MPRKTNGKERKSRVILDEKDEAILHCLEANPEILLKNISKVLEDEGGLSIPYPTVQRRLNKLTKSGVISRNVSSVNWATAGYMVRYRVGILIDPTVLRNSTITETNYDSQESLADYIRKDLPRDDRFQHKLLIDDVYILLGGNVDLAVDFFAKDDKTATKFIIDALRKLPGISNTVSAKLAYSSKHGWLSKNEDE